MRTIVKTKGRQEAFKLKRISIGNGMIILVELYTLY